MNRKLLIASLVAIVGSFTNGMADDFEVIANVSDVEKIIVRTEFEEDDVICSTPRNSTRQVEQSNNGSNMLLGCLGGTGIGMGVSNKKDKAKGAALGCVAGGFIGHNANDLFNVPQSNSAPERTCTNFKKIREVNTIENVVTWRYSGLHGSFVTDANYKVGDTVTVRINATVVHR